MLSHNRMNIYHVLSKSCILAHSEHAARDDVTGEPREQFPQLLATSEGCQAREITGITEDGLNASLPLSDNIILGQFLQILYLFAREEDHTLINVLVSEL